MSKCGIVVQFDRDRPVYHGGETVSGTVLVEVNQTVTCNGITLRRFWQTHGTGDSDSGTAEEIPLSGGCELVAGELLEFPFAFTAECEPVTYRGHHINVDHYVRVEVDVPWSIGPVLDEDYILRPGQRPAHMTGRRDIVETAPEVDTPMPLFLKVFLGVLAIVFVGLISIFAIFFLPIIALIAAIYYVRRRMIAARVGGIEVEMPNVVVAPGELWPLELSFTPRKSFAVNGITVRLTGIESASSGSGTNRRTRTHTLHDSTHTLQTAPKLVGGQPIHHHVEIPIPDSRAFSLDQSDNDIVWTAEVRIDMPFFPDWKRSQQLQLVPAEFLETQPTPQPELAPLTAVQSVNATPPPLPTSNDSGLVELIEQLTATSRFGPEREELVEASAHSTFDVHIDVQQCSTTFSSEMGPTYDNGRTLTGTVLGTRHEVQLYTLPNTDADDLARGDQFRTRATIHKWDSLYDRLVLVEVPT